MPTRRGTPTGNNTGSGSVDDDERLIIRAATAADIDTFYGYLPPQTVRALVACIAEKPVGIIGLAREAECIKIFSEYGPELKGHLKCIAVLRAIKTVMKWVRSSTLPVVAVAQCDEQDAKRLLERLGFEFFSPGKYGDLYLWPI